MFLSNKLPKSLGVCALLMAALMLPAGCEREANDVVQPGGRGAGAARLGTAGCESYFFARNLGTWNVVPGSRFQVVVGPLPNQEQYVAQIIPGPLLGSRFIVRGGQFLNRGDFVRAGGILPNAGTLCFVPGPDNNGFFVPGFNVNNLGSAFETVQAPDGSPAYRVRTRFLSVTDPFITKTGLGTWSVVPNAPLEARFIPGYGLVVAQNVTNAIPVSRSLGRDCFIIRGRNILQRSDVSLPDLLDRGRTEAFVDVETDLNGLFPPPGSIGRAVPGYELLPAGGGFDATYRKLP